MIGYTIIDMAEDNVNICGRCGRDTIWMDGYRCGGKVCTFCGWEDINNTYY